MTIWRKDIPIIYDLLQKSRHKHANAGPKLIEHTLPETEIAPARKLPQKETHLPTMIFFCAILVSGRVMILNLYGTPENFDGTKKEHPKKKGTIIFHPPPFLGSKCQFSRVYNYI